MPFGGSSAPTPSSEAASESGVADLFYVGRVDRFEVMEPGEACAGTRPTDRLTGGEVERRGGDAGGIRRSSIR